MSMEKAVLVSLARNAGEKIVEELLGKGARLVTTKEVLAEVAG